MKRLDGLDALRGIAAMLVFIGHTGYMAGAFSWSAMFLAVDFFFMLSGYVMARTYEGKLGHSLSGGRFFLKRVRRLWPTMAFGTALAIPLALTLPDAGAIIALGLLLLPSAFMLSAYPLNLPAWSIFFELVANALHGIILHKLATRTLARIAFVAGCLYATLGAHFGTFDLGADAVEFIGGFPRVVLSYLIGVILWRTWRDRPPLAVPPLATFLLLPLGIAAASLAPNLLSLPFIILVCPLAMAGGLRWAAGQWGSIAGAMSFPLYAIHWPLLYYYSFSGFPTVAGAILTLCIALVMGLAPSLRIASNARATT